VIATAHHAISQCSSIQDLQHNLFLLSQSNQLFLCPAGKDKPLNRVLDAGTGTGVWAVEFGMFLDPPAFAPRGG
jgi:hypothetical protein